MPTQNPGSTGKNPVKRGSKKMQTAARKNDDLVELLALKSIIAQALDETDSARDKKALALEYREILKDIREVGMPPEEEDPTAKAMREVQELSK